MSFEILHFRDADKILSDKKMTDDVIATLEYIDSALFQAHFKGELLRQALDDMDWRENGTMNIIEGRRYQYKGCKKRVAIEGNFSVYEYIIDGLARLQIGYDNGNLDTGILMLTSQRSSKTPYGSTVELVQNEIEQLYPTISMPVSIALFNLGRPDLPEE